MAKGPTSSGPCRWPAISPARAGGREDGGLHPAHDQGPRRAGRAGVRRDRHEPGGRDRRGGHRRGRSPRAIEPSIVSIVSSRSQPSRKTVPEAIALGMLDRSAEVLKVETDQGTEFVLRTDLDDAQAEPHDRVRGNDRAGRLARQLYRPPGPRIWLRETAGRRIARRWPAGLALPPEAVIEDQSLVGDWRPVMLEHRGPDHAAQGAAAGNAHRHRDQRPQGELDRPADRQHGRRLGGLPAAGQFAGRARRE